MRHLFILAFVLVPTLAFGQKTVQPPGIPYTSPPQTLQQFFNPSANSGGGGYGYWPTTSTGIPEVATTGGGTASTVNQGTPGTAANAWFETPVIGGALGFTSGNPGVVSITGTLPAFASTPTFNIGTAPTIAVTGTFFQTTQPVSAASLPLPTGAATSANQTNGSQTTGLVAGSAIVGKVGIDQTTPGTTNGVQTLSGSVTIATPPTSWAGTPTQTAATCGTSSGTVLAASAAATAVSFHLQQVAANPVYLNFAGGTASTSATGSSFDLQPGQTISFSLAGGLLPTSAVTCIAAASTTVVVTYK